jgi:hypothetical protein
VLLPLCWRQSSLLVPHLLLLILQLEEIQVKDLGPRQAWHHHQQQLQQLCQWASRLFQMKQEHQMNQEHHRQQQELQR